MSEQEQQINDLYERDNLLSFPSNTAQLKTCPNKKDVALLRLSEELQSTSDLKKLILIYSRNLNTLIPHNSIRFSNNLIGIDIPLGKVARHSCSYNLRFSGESLGKLTLTRKNIFTENELGILEDFLSVLFYPLGNAIYN